MLELSNLTSIMERETISKNRVSPKNDKSRINTIKCPFFLIFALAIILFGTSCKNTTTIDDANNPENSTENVTKTSGNLKEDYNAWFQLQEKYVEYFNLSIKEVQLSESSWNTQQLVVALVENVTDKERGGFFIAKDIHFSITALDEVITTLENIITQIKSDMRKYNCQRLYNTSYGITITFQYSSSESKWNNVKIYYASEEYPVEIKPEYLMSYIQGLKDCKQNIIDFTTGNWSNN
jgi:hypothetical protein